VEWPKTREEMIAAQEALAAASPGPWELPRRELLFGGCYVCFGRGSSGPGKAGDPGWAAAALTRGIEIVRIATVEGLAGAPYEAGLLGLREGPLLEAAVRALPALPDVLLVNATGRDHPRRAGLALHLGAILGVPTVGVTHRTLVAVGEWPEDRAGATSPVTIDGEVVGYWLRTQRGARPLVVHAAWRTDAETAGAVVLAADGSARTPEPLRIARQAARLARQEAISG